MELLSDLHAAHMGATEETEEEKEWVEKFKWMKEQEEETRGRGERKCEVHTLSPIHIWPASQQVPKCVNDDDALSCSIRGPIGVL